MAGRARRRPRRSMATCRGAGSPVQPRTPPRSSGPSTSCPSTSAGPTGHGRGPCDPSRREPAQAERPLRQAASVAIGQPALTLDDECLRYCGRLCIIAPLMRTRTTLLPASATFTISSNDHYRRKVAADAVRLRGAVHRRPARRSGWLVMQPQQQPGWPRQMVDPTAEPHRASW